MKNKFFFVSNVNASVHNNNVHSVTVTQNSSEITKIKIEAKLHKLSQHIQSCRFTNIENNEITIVLACEDFFESVDNKNKTCFNLETIYQELQTTFCKFSKNYPNVLICPGSFYVSVSIVDAPKHLVFEQDNETKKLLHKTTCYTTNLMPILYNGKLIKIIRKGEEIQYKNHKEKFIPLNYIDDLEYLNTNKLKVISYHEDGLTEMFTDGEKSGTCYLGKTLLPGEKDLIAKYFPDIQLKNLFGHEFSILNKTFCALICGEFRLNDNKGTLGTSGLLLKQKQYDYVLHSTIGGDIDKALYNKQPCYLHSDNGKQTKVLILGKEVKLESPSLISSDNIHLMSCHF